MDLTVHNTDVQRNILIKLNKQIGNSFANISNTKVNSKLCQTAEMELFPQVVTGFRGKLSCHISKMKLFAKIVKSEKRFTIFAKNSNLDV